MSVAVVRALLRSARATLVSLDTRALGDKISALFDVLARSVAGAVVLARRKLTALPSETATCEARTLETSRVALSVSAAAVRALWLATVFTRKVRIALAPVSLAKTVTRATVQAGLGSARFACPPVFAQALPVVARPVL